MCGLSGSGKTWLSERLMASLPAIRIRSDIERKRLFGVEETAASGSGIGAGIYTPEASVRTYERLFALARDLLKARHHVVLDAAFLDKEQRDAASNVAADLGVDPVLVCAEAPVDVLRARIGKRAASKNEASEADLAVLDHQLETATPVGGDGTTICVDTSLDIDIESLVSAILERRSN